MAAGGNSSNILELVVRAVATGVEQALGAAGAAAEKLGTRVVGAGKQADAAMKAFEKATQSAAEAAQKAAEGGIARLGRELEKTAQLAEDRSVHAWRLWAREVEAAAESAEKSAAEVEAAVEAAGDGAAAALKDSADRMESEGNRLADGFDSFAGSIVNALETIAVAVGAALGAAVAFAGRELDKFNDKLVAIENIGIAREEVDKFKASIVDMADKTSTSVTELATGLETAVSAGVENTAEALALLETANKLAVGGFTETNKAAGLLTTALNTYGGALTSTEERIAFVKDVSDKLNAVVDVGAISVEQLADGFGRIAPTANLAGVKIEEVGASIALLTAAGLRPEQAINALGQSIAKLAAPGEKAREVAKALGIEIGEAAIKSKGFPAVLADIIDKTGGSIEALRPLLEDIDAVRAVSTIAAVGIDKFNVSLAEISNAAGNTEADFARAMETITNQVGKLRNVFVNRLAPAFESEVFPVIKSALADLTAFFEENGEAMAKTAGKILGVFVEFAKFLANNGPTIIAVIGAIFASKALNLFLGSLVSIQRALGTVGAALTTLSNVSGASFSAIAGSVGVVGGALLALIPVAVFVATKMVEAIGSFRDFAKAALAEVADETKRLHEEVLKSTGRTVEMVKEFAAEDAGLARAAADAAISEHKRRAEVIEKDLAASTDRRARLEEAVAKTAEGSARRALERELGFAKAKEKALADRVLDETRAIDTIEAETDKAIHDGALAAVAAAEDKKKVSGASAADAIAKIRAIEGEEKASLDRRAKEFDKFFGGIAKAMRESGEILAKEARSLQDPFSAISGPEARIEIPVQVDPDDLQHTTRSVERALIEGGQRGSERVQTDLEKAGQGAAVKIGQFLGNALGSAASFFGDKLLGVASAVGDFFLDLFVKGPIGEFFALLQLASATPAQGGEDQAGFAEVLDEALQGFVDAITNLVDNLPMLLGRLAGFIPEIVQAVVAAVPQIIQAAVSGIGPVIDAIVAAVPLIVDSLVANLPTLIDKLASELPRIVAVIGDAIVDIVRGLFSSNVVSTLIEAIIESLGDLLPTLIELLSELVAHFMDTAPALIVSLVDMIVGDLIPSIIREIPQILFAFVEGLPDFISTLVGGIVGTLIEELPGLIMMLVDLLVFQFPQIVGALIRALYEAFIALVVEIGEKIAAAFRDGLQMENIGKTIGRFILAVITGGISEMIRGAGGRDRRNAEVDANAAYEEALAAWQAGAAGRDASNPEDAAWLAANPPPNQADYTFHDGGVVAAGRAQRYHFGGMVRAMEGAFARAGAREVPAVLEEGESVLNRGATSRLGASGVHALNSGAGGGGGNTYILQNPVVDPDRSLDAQVARLMEKGEGRTGKVAARARGVPIRGVAKWGSA